MFGALGLVLSVFFGLGAGRSPKGDWKRRAQKKRRPDFGACGPCTQAKDVAGFDSELMYGERILEC